MLVIVVLLLAVVIVLVVVLPLVVVFVLVVVVVAGYIQVTAASQLCRSALSYVSGLNSAHREKEDDKGIRRVSPALAAYSGWRHGDGNARHSVVCLLC